MTDLVQVLILMSPSILYAVAGAIQARNEKEPFNPTAFAKTLIVGGLGTGLLSQTQADEATAFASSGVFVLVVDKALEALRRILQKPTPTAT